MADAVDKFEVIANSTLVSESVFWDIFTIMENILNQISHMSSQVIHIDATIDTSTADTLTDTLKQTNLLDGTLAAPQQVYIRSSAAADQGLKCKLYGQKVVAGVADTPQWYTFTTDAADGTTPVDCGTFYCGMFAEKVDVCAGNLIIDDDGASNEVYFTLTLGATPTKGQIIIPYGYKGALVGGRCSLNAVPAASGNANLIALGEWKDILETYSPTSDSGKYGKVYSESEQFPLETAFKTAVTEMNIHLYFVIGVPV